MSAQEAVPPAPEVQEAESGNASAERDAIVFLAGLGLQIFIVWLTAIGLFFKRDIKALIEKSGVETVSATDYLSADRRKGCRRLQYSCMDK